MSAQSSSAVLPRPTVRLLAPTDSTEMAFAECEPQPEAFPSAGKPPAHVLVVSPWAS
jgi:hypothetical protein